MKALEPILISGREVLPLLEGGKGVSISTGTSSGAWAAAGAVGTVSCINPDSHDENNQIIPQVYHNKVRSQRFEELIAYAIQGGIAQARIAHEASGGQGRIHMNFLWEAGGTEQILKGVMEGAKGMVHGVTCGAGMPYKVAEIVSRFGVFYYPIVSSARAFRALWKRAYHKYADYLGGVVYEDPWKAGGHNGISNSEDPNKPQDPYDRVREMRGLMRGFGLGNVPIVMAGGVWYLREWEDWIDNEELGPIVFQLGTRPLLTKESRVQEAWREKMLSLKEGDVVLNRFSPTGFYSSAIKNRFLEELEERSQRQVPYSRAETDDHTAGLPLGPRQRLVYLKPEDKARCEEWIAQGFTEGMKTPDSTLIFVTPEKTGQILKDQQECMGCLSACRFSNWSQNEEGTTGKMADPRSFCIQKTLQDIAHGGVLDDNLMFSGHNGYRFATDPFYNDGFIPTVKQLIDRLLTGD